MSNDNPKSAKIALAYHERKEKYKWRAMVSSQRKADRRGTAMERGTHIDEGFPHINHRGRCMCLQPCCNNDQGCKCKLCICHTSGKDHSELASLLANTIMSLLKAG